MKKKILKIIGIIIIVFIILFLIHTLRNYTIITSLQDKISQYSNSENYYVKSVSSNETVLAEMEYYRKAEKQVVFMKRTSDNIKMSIYDNGERIDTFVETENSKTVTLDCSELVSVQIYNTLENDNNWQTLLSCITARISKTTYNNKECYIVKGFMSSTSLTTEDAEVYIEKNTGLLLKTVENEIITEKEYEFNNVDDSIFTEPDIGQYTLQEE